MQAWHVWVIIGIILSILEILVKIVTEVTAKIAKIEIAITISISVNPFFCILFSTREILAEVQSACHRKNITVTQSTLSFGIEVKQDAT